MFSLFWTLIQTIELKIQWLCGEKSHQCRLLSSEELESHHITHHDHEVVEFFFIVPWTGGTKNFMEFHGAVMDSTVPWRPNGKNKVTAVDGTAHFTAVKTAVFSTVSGRVSSQQKQGERIETNKKMEVDCVDQGDDQLHDASFINSSSSLSRSYSALVNFFFVFFRFRSICWFWGIWPINWVTWMDWSFKACGF